MESTTGSRGLLACYFANHTQGVFAQDLFQVTIGIASFDQNRGQRGHLGNILNAVHDPRNAIEIGANPHMIDSRDFHRVVKVIRQVVERGRDQVFFGYG